MKIESELDRLIDAGVIDLETAIRIREFYRNTATTSTNRLFMVFGVLGAILVGLGIILIIAHNWDELPKSIKTTFAFIPLLTGQILCAYTLVKKQDSIPWREASAAFLFFAIGASISLVSQIYHIPGGTGTFLLTWMLLSLPLIYLMNSSVTSLLCIAGSTYYAAHLGYWTYPRETPPYLYWLLLIMTLPHYFHLCKNHPGKNFTATHHWTIGLSLSLTLATVDTDFFPLLFVAYMSLFGLFYLAGNLRMISNENSPRNGLETIGSLGTIGLLLALSFEWYWETLISKIYDSSDLFISPEFYAAVIPTLISGYLLFRAIKENTIRKLNPLSYVFVVFALVFLVGLKVPVGAMLMNLMMLGIGVWTIKDGARQDHLGILNYGLLMITALVMCRFFDTDLSFIVRGLLFIGVGGGFFAANYLMLKKRKSDE